MKVGYGKGTTKYGPGVQIDMTDDEVAITTEAYLVALRIHVSGPRTITVNGEPCDNGQICVDPEGFVIRKGQKISGRGPDKPS